MTAYAGNACSCQEAVPPISPLLRDREESKHQVIACKKPDAAGAKLEHSPQKSLMHLASYFWARVKAHEMSGTHAWQQRRHVSSSCCILAELYL